MIVRRLYSIYCLAVFGGLFLMLLPGFLLFAQKKSWQRKGLWLNHIWARAFFPMCGISVELEFKCQLYHNKRYIFCPNHFSFLDIALMSLTPVPFAFVGKSSMSGIPVFGYMYRKLHILVDRSNIRSRYETLQQSLLALKRGLNLTIFPEGGIASPNPPKMTRFKPGAFKAALESGAMVVPVTLPFNWIFLPDDHKFLPDFRPLKIVYHEPIDPNDYSIDTIDELSSRVFNIIADELKRSNSNESNERDVREDGSPGKVGSKKGR